MGAAKDDALIHAAQNGCEPAIPLVQPEAITALKPPGVLVVDCPAGCGVTLPVPLTITDTVELGVDRDELRARFTAEAPELHDLVYRHLLNCAVMRSWIYSSPNQAVPAPETWAPARSATV
jgi:hypothetical protein